MMAKKGRTMIDQIYALIPELPEKTLALGIDFVEADAAQTEERKGQFLVCFKSIVPLAVVSSMPIINPYIHLAMLLATIGCAGFVLYRAQQHEKAIMLNSQHSSPKRVYVAKIAVANGRSEKLMGKAFLQSDLWTVVRRRALVAGIKTEIGCHTFRATGIRLVSRTAASWKSLSRWPRTTPCGFLPNPLPAVFTTNLHISLHSSYTAKIRQFKPK